MALATSTDITVAGYKTSDDRIKDGDNFELELDLTNNTSQAINDIYIQIDSGSAFSLDGKGSKTKVASTIAANATKKVTLKLEFDGTDKDKFSFDLLYGDKTTSDYVKLPIYIPRETTDDDDDEDDKNDRPVLSMGDSPDKDTVEPGESASISITLDNTGKDDAKNIRITPIITEGDIEIDDYEDEIDKIKDGKDEDASFSFDIDKKAKNGTYKIGFQVRYEGDDETYTDSDTFYGYIKIEGSDEEPELLPDSVSIQGNTLKAGQQNLVFIDFKNVTERTATDVRIRLKGYTTEGIRLYQDTPIKELGTLDPGEKGSTGYVLEADESMKTGTYELTAQIDYKDDRDKKYSVEEPIFVTVEEKNYSNIGLKFENVKHPTGKFPGEKDFQIAFDIVNTGIMTAEDVEVKIKDANGKLIYKSNPELTFDEIGAGARQTASFDMMTPKNIDSNFYPLYAEITYAKGDERSKTISEPVGFYIDGESTSENSIPKIIIKDYDLGGDNKILAGTETDVTFVFENTSSERVQNVKVSLEVEEGVFSFVDMASSFYIGNISAKGTASKTIKMKTKNDAAVKSYKLTTKLQYENSKGVSYDENDKPFESEEFINVPVRQKFRLETGEIELPRDAIVGEEGDIYVDFYNMGKSKMYNLMVKAEGNFEISGSNSYIGDFEPASEKSFEAGVTPTEEGTVEGKIIFEFEDAEGNIQTKEVPFSYDAMAAPDMSEMEGMDGMDGMDGFEDMEGMDGMDGEGSGSSKTIWIIIGVIAVAGIIGIIVYKKKKKAKELEGEFEDE